MLIQRWSAIHLPAGPDHWAEAMLTPMTAPQTPMPGALACSVKVVLDRHGTGFSIEPPIA